MTIVPTIVAAAVVLAAATQQADAAPDLKLGETTMRLASSRPASR